MVDLRGEDINANPNEENSEDILDFSTNSFGSSDYSTYYNYDYYDNFNEDEYSLINNSSRRKRYGAKMLFFLVDLMLFTITPSTQQVITMCYIKSKLDK